MAVKSGGRWRIAQPRPSPGVKPKADAHGYQLVWGLHRLEAASQLAMGAIACQVLDAGLSDDVCRLVELRENLDRNELTGAERKAFAAEVGRILAKMAENCQEEEFANGENWIMAISEKMAIVGDYSR